MPPAHIREEFELAANRRSDAHVLREAGHMLRDERQDERDTADAAREMVKKRRTQLCSSPCRPWVGASSS
jgi:hypothetical protein